MVESKFAQIEATIVQKHITDIELFVLANVRLSSGAGSANAATGHVGKLGWVRRIQGAGKTHCIFANEDLLQFDLVVCLLAQQQLEALRFF